MIYNLHTKTDEQEELIMELRATHEKEIQQMRQESNTSIQTEGKLREQLSILQKENDRLLGNQVLHIAIQAF